MKRLCVFCGSNTGNAAIYADRARRFGEVLAGRNIGVVYGGGHVGLMGVLADAVLQGGGEVIGVIPQDLVDRELAHTGLTKLHVVATMHQRKALMADLADGFVALPGGFGTADELLEILTWAQLGLHAKPVGLLQVDGFFEPLLAWLDRCVQDGFVRPEHRRLLLSANDPDVLLGELEKHAAAPPIPKWIGRADR